MVSHKVEKEFWDQRYAAKDFVCGVEPNAFFRQEILKISHGRLLLPGEGEGRNAAFAASIGGKVIAFDQSSEGRKKALRLAKREGVEIVYLVAALNEFNAKPESFDCIAIVFVHFTEAERNIIHQKLLSFINLAFKVVNLRPEISADIVGRNSF